MTAQTGHYLAGRVQRRPLRWRGGLVIAVAILAVSAPETWACEWWGCGDGPYAYRPPPRAYGYRSPAWAYGHRGARWAYGFTSPARVYGDAYVAWPSTSIPQTRWYLNTATQVPNAAAVGLTAPVTSGQGLLEAGLPPRGPSLFGPSPPPPPAVWGYYYGPYGAPAYGYRAAPSPYAYGAPPADTPSWWLEPRRRR